MKALYFSLEYTTHDRRFLQSLVKAGYAVYYLRMRSSAYPFEQRPLPARICELQWNKPRLTWIPPGSWLRKLMELRQLINAVNPEVILAGPVQECALMVAMLGFRALVTMSWGSDVLVNAERNFWQRTLSQFTLRRSAGVLGDCQAVRDKVHALVCYPDERIVTFPWGVDLDEFKPGPAAFPLRRELAWDKNPVLISTRTWEPRYAVDVLVTAFSNLHRKHPEVRLLLLGNGSQEALIRRQIAELGLESIVHAPGRVAYSLLPEYFRSADLYVSTALSDGTSVSLLEAMACGLPVVVTKGYGNAEWVVERENGWLVPPADADALATALEEAVTNPGVCRKCGNANVRLARERADWSRNFSQLLDLFGQVSTPSV